ncbi:PepSY domain-containing protein [Bradyrhizobium erythrophlei]|uniref:Peptidase propeptide and YPEB domain-containing protein n=1 Tax=Bradyrhizobium erythrophlei TaxID=1437360 RepID=A0A1M5XBV0_9BRAD|nr:PepSY domain-containing protein [Bradyrhizobium erythrophlei]SHH97335.1 Peptidase propeptide and YPEB domain-containing protein [Bradyrhizobium erythrophlei]
MRKTGILSFLIVCAVAPAFAQRTPEPDVVPTEKVIQSFEKAKITLAEAIRIAAKKHKDAKVVDISFDSQADQLAYKVKTYQDNNVWEGAIDAWTGEIIGEGITTPVSKLDEEDQLELAGSLKALIDLATATALAEEKGSGKAISAGLEEANGRIVYEVTIVDQGATTKFVIDPRSGQIK